MDPSPIASQRRRTFSSSREPLQHHRSLLLNRDKTCGPFRFLNPTRAHFHHRETGEEHRAGLNAPNHEQAADKVEYRWTSRNNRKGRHQLDVTLAQDPATAKYLVPESTNSPREILNNIGRIFTHYPYWDVSWLVAYVFTWGSIVWVINSFFVFLPLVRPDSEFPNEILDGGGITAFIGATIFEFGSFLLMLEAVNENRTGCFGWAVEQILSGSGGQGPYLRVVQHSEGCKHHHRNKKNLVGIGAHEPADNNDEAVDLGSTAQGDDVTHDTQRSWTWVPTMHELRTHYLHELGFLACCSQLFGASVFWISGFTALPGILNHLSQVVENVIYWLPQVIGGTGFIVSGTLFMIETQEKWYKPAPLVLGWHVGFWNLIGGIGFTLCPAFGFDTASWAQYQASCSTFWGSWAFLIGSAIQLYESLQKHPVEVERPVKTAIMVPKADPSGELSDRQEV